MSDLARLAALIESTSEPMLSNQIAKFVDPNAPPGNQFALASLLLSRRSLEARIRGLSRERLTHLIAGKSDPDLKSAWLADESGAFEAAASQASELLAKSEASKSPEIPMATEVSVSDSVRYLTEICYFTRRHWLKASNRGLRTADIRALALRLHSSEEVIRICFDLLVARGLIETRDYSWVLSQRGEQWLTQDFAQRWLSVAEEALKVSPISFITKQSASQGGLATQLHLHYPLLSLEIASIVSTLGALGLLSAGEPESQLLGLFEEQVSAKQRIAEISKRTSTVQPKVVIQSDLSVLVTGPLTERLWSDLDEVAQAQELGIASSFRITLASVTSALQAGWSTSKISKFLAEQSGRDVPQPVSFLLRDAERRFGELEVFAEPRGCSIRSRDAILLTQIQNEPSLSHLRLRQTDPNHFESHLHWREAGLSLRAAGYPALLPTVQAPKLLGRETASNWIAGWLSAIRVGAQSEASTRAQLLQFALRDALPLRICYRGPQGDATVLVRVLGVTPQRIRCREVGREAELTLPQSSISEISIAQG